MMQNEVIDIISLSKDMFELNCITTDELCLLAYNNQYETIKALL